jgi:hypothetical protein
VPQSSRRDYNAVLDWDGVNLLFMTTSSNSSRFSREKYSPSDFRERLPSNCDLICGYRLGVSLAKRAAWRKSNRIMAYNQQYNIIDESALIVIYAEEKRRRSKSFLLGERTLIAIPALRSIIPLIKDRFEPDLDNSEKLFSFGQNYNNIEQN